LRDIKGLAHLTGGGFIENIPRILPEGMAVEIRKASWPIPPLFSLIQQKGEVPPEETYRVFNMGIGMVAIVASENAPRLQKMLSEKTFIIGEVVAGDKKVILV
jgi:phosphoribosylaminoimidazole (AIR) synthetase